MRFRNVAPRSPPKLEKRRRFGRNVADYLSALAFEAQLAPTRTRGPRASLRAAKVNNPSLWSSGVMSPNAGGADWRPVGRATRQRKSPTGHEIIFLLSRPNLHTAVGDIGKQTKEIRRVDRAGDPSALFVLISLRRCAGPPPIQRNQLARSLSIEQEPGDRKRRLRQLWPAARRVHASARPT